MTLGGGGGGGGSCVPSRLQSTRVGGSDHAGKAQAVSPRTRGSSASHHFPTLVSGVERPSVPHTARFAVLLDPLPGPIFWRFALTKPTGNSSAGPESKAGSWSPPLPDARVSVSERILPWAGRDLPQGVSTRRDHGRRGRGSGRGAHAKHRQKK